MQRSKTPIRSGNHGWAGGSDSQLARTGLNSPHATPVGKGWWQIMPPDPVSIVLTPAALLAIVCGLILLGFSLRSRLA